MKKASRNLVLRSETLRTLAGLDLARVAGGVESGTQSGAFQCSKVVAFDSGRTHCPEVIAFDSGAAHCPR